MLCYACAPASLQVAGYMRSVLHTLAQCHSHRILHRDIKPGGLMPLAAHLQPARLPAPLPASLPTTLHTCPTLACPAAIWKGILTEQPSFRRSAWKEASEEARDFVSTLLNKASCVCGCGCGCPHCPMRGAVTVAGGGLYACFCPCACPCPPLHPHPVPARPPARLPACLSACLCRTTPSARAPRRPCATPGSPPLSTQPSSAPSAQPWCSASSALRRTTRCGEPSWS